MKQRVYKDLQPRHRYQSNDFWITLIKKGYHPKTGAHKPTISVTDYNEYLLEAQLASGKFVLDGWSYPVLEWKFISRTHHDRYDTVNCIYELALDTSAIPVDKYKYQRPDDEQFCGVRDARVSRNYRVGGPLVRLIKKRALFDGMHHELVISAPYYHVDMIKSNLKSGAIEFHHMLYLVSNWEEIPRQTALKKDGTPYFSRSQYIKIVLKAPGRKIQYNHERRPSILDEMFENVQL